MYQCQMSLRADTQVGAVGGHDDLDGKYPVSNDSKDDQYNV
mgnify:CR=1 FL=1